MERCRDRVKDSIAMIDNGVDFVVRCPTSLNIEHHIADCIILVPVVVVESVYRPTMEVPVSIFGVTGLFMCIDCPVQKVDEFIFVVDNCCCRGRDVVWHAIISLDRHKLVVRVQQGISHRPIPKVSIKLAECPIAHYYYLLIIRI